MPLPTVNLDLVAERLFENSKIAARLRRDYGLDGDGSPQDLAAQMVRAFGQDPGSTADDFEPTNRDVFRAAVRALASNSRSWSAFLKNEKRLEELLHGYDPVATATALANESHDFVAVAACLPGQTSTADAVTIDRWAEMLAGHVPYYAGLRSLRDGLVAELKLGDDEVVPMVAVVLGVTSRGMERRWPPPSGLPTWKACGMGPILASEF